MIHLHEWMEIKTAAIGVLFVCYIRGRLWSVQKSDTRRSSSNLVSGFNWSKKTFCRCSARVNVERVFYDEISADINCPKITRIFFMHACSNYRRVARREPRPCFQFLASSHSSTVCINALEEKSTRFKAAKTRSGCWVCLCRCRWCVQVLAARNSFFATTINVLSLLALYFFPCSVLRCCFIRFVQEEEENRIDTWAGKLRRLYSSFTLMRCIMCRMCFTCMIHSEFCFRARVVKFTRSFISKVSSFTPLHELNNLWTKKSLKRPVPTRSFDLPSTKSSCAHMFHNNFLKIINSATCLRPF